MGLLTLLFTCLPLRPDTGKVSTYLPLRFKLCQAGCRSFCTDPNRREAVRTDSQQDETRVTAQIRRHKSCSNHSLPQFWFRSV